MSRRLRVCVYGVYLREYVIVSAGSNELRVTEWESENLMAYSEQSAHT